MEMPALVRVGQAAEGDANPIDWVGFLQDQGGRSIDLGDIISHSFKTVALDPAIPGDFLKAQNHRPQTAWISFYARAGDGETDDEGLGGEDEDDQESEGDGQEED